jgi:hypothetical protein
VIAWFCEPCLFHALNTVLKPSRSFRAIADWNDHNYWTSNFVTCAGLAVLKFKSLEGKLPISTARTIDFDASDASRIGDECRIGHGC